MKILTSSGRSFQIYTATPDPAVEHHDFTLRCTETLVAQPNDAD